MRVCIALAIGACAAPTLVQSKTKVEEAEVQASRLADSEHDVAALQRMVEHAEVQASQLHDSKEDIKSLEQMQSHYEQEAKVSHEHEVVLSKGLLAMKKDLDATRNQTVTMSKSLLGMGHLATVQHQVNNMLSKGVIDMQSALKNQEQEKVTLSKGVIAMEHTGKQLSQGVLDMKKQLDADEKEKIYLSKGVVDLQKALDAERAKESELQQKVSADDEDISGMQKLLDKANGEEVAKVSFVQLEQDSSCPDDHKRLQLFQTKIASFLQGYCEDMCKTVMKHPDCSVCDGFIPPDATPGVQTWDELYAQFDKLKLVGRDLIKGWTGDAGKFGR